MDPSWVTPILALDLCHRFHLSRTQVWDLLLRILDLLQLKRALASL